ncbi:MAG TPA: hypothetical protein PK625_02935 [Spirochaetales bacterium]|nr:hypothetical protein [Spirochaetales bacterium]
MELNYRFGHLGLSARLAAAGGLYAVAVVCQTILRLPLLSAPAIAAAWLVLAIKPVTNKPDDQGLEEWRPVSVAEVDRIADGIRETRNIKAKLAGPVALGVLGLAVLGLAALIAVPVSGTLSLALIDTALFSVPGLFFGRVSAFTPPTLNRVLPSFLSVMSVRLPDGFVLTPYLRFDKDADGKDVPEDMRLMLEPRRKPADLVGVQFQVAINTGPNGQVPYMYAVVLTRGRSGPTHASFAEFRARGYEVERGGDDDYGTVVIRQRTERGGYHTDHEDCERLIHTVLAGFGVRAA